MTVSPDPQFPTEASTQQQSSVVWSPLGHTATALTSCWELGALLQFRPGSLIWAAITWPSAAEGSMYLNYLNERQKEGKEWRFFRYRYTYGKAKKIAKENASKLRIFSMVFWWVELTSPQIGQAGHQGVRTCYSLNTLSGALTTCHN